MREIYGYSPQSQYKKKSHTGDFTLVSLKDISYSSVLK